MRFRSILGALALCLLFSVAARADDITVTNASSAGWVQISPNTFGLPADLSAIGCGSENETTCEPLGVFNFNIGFSSSGVMNIVDDTDAIGDQIHFFNNASGLGVVTFASDPSLGELLPNGVTLCQEDIDLGCIGVFTITATDGSKITLSAASDGEAVFDPFGLNADSSDELKVEGATIVGPPVGTPEPGSLALLGSGLLGLAAIRRKRLPHTN
jgi:hypothetical protein